MQMFSSKIGGKVAFSAKLYFMAQVRFKTPERRRELQSRSKFSEQNVSLSADESVIENIATQWIHKIFEQEIPPESFSVSITV